MAQQLATVCTETHRSAWGRNQTDQPTVFEYCLSGGYAVRWLSWRLEDAAVIQTYLHGPSTRSADEPVKAMGMSGISEVGESGGGGGVAEPLDRDAGLAAVALLYSL